MCTIAGLDSILRGVMFGSENSKHRERGLLLWCNEIVVDGSANVEAFVETLTHVEPACLQLYGVLLNYSRQEVFYGAPQVLWTFARTLQLSASMLAKCNSIIPGLHGCEPASHVPRTSLELSEEQLFAQFDCCRLVEL